jgi:putative phosphoesterase
MRIALISDIHGNYIALEAVLADIERAGVDQIICLGDVATLGSQPLEVLARLRALDCPVIRGNHEDALLEPELMPQHGVGPHLASTMAWCAERLSAADYDYLRGMPRTLEVPLGGQTTMFCYHAAPRSNTAQILATTPPGNLDAMISDYPAPIMVGGHTHIQMLRQHKGRLLVNPGSVGHGFVEMPWPQHEGPHLLPWAEYGIVTWQAGVISADLRRVPFDLNAAAELALASGLPAGPWLAGEYRR